MAPPAPAGRIDHLPPPVIPALTTSQGRERGSGLTGSTAPRHENRQGAGRPTPTILYLVTEDWYFYLHRLPMARAARDAGARVVVATRVGDYGAAIEGEGFALRPLAWRRGSLSPLAELRNLAAIRRLYRRGRPGPVAHLSPQPQLFRSPPPRR